MLTQSHFYHQTVKKTVALFGTLFNNITIARTSGNVLSNVERVPISYGPKQKFLVRINEQPDLSTPKVAIKVPRMSFEITSIAYDTAIHLNKLNKLSMPIQGDTLHNTTQWQASPYRIGMQLNIYGRNQDDVLQILEQILPTFNPDYVVSVKDMNGPGFNADVPIVLNSVALSDDYEGDPANTRRVIVYSLDFDIRVKFTGPIAQHGIIRFTEAALIPNTNGRSPAEYVHVHLGSSQDTPSNYTVITSIDTFGFTGADPSADNSSQNVSSANITVDSY